MTKNVHIVFKTRISSATLRHPIHLYQHNTYTTVLQHCECYFWAENDPFHKYYMVSGGPMVGSLSSSTG